jgi:hypothetical protein
MNRPALAAIGHHREPTEIFAFFAHSFAVAISSLPDAYISRIVRIAITTAALDAIIRLVRVSAAKSPWLRSSGCSTGQWRAFAC